MLKRHLITIGSPLAAPLRHLITIGCLLAALFLYSADARSEAGLVLLGVVFEGAFWLRLVRGIRKG